MPDEEVIQVCMRYYPESDMPASFPFTLRCYDCNAFMVAPVNAPPYDECICNVCWLNGRPQWSRS